MRTEKGLKDLITGCLISKLGNQENILEAVDYLVETLKEEENLIIPHVMATLNLNENAVEKLEYIRGRGFRHDFPNQQPSQEWIGAVCDFLDETDS